MVQQLQEEMANIRKVYGFVRRIAAPLLGIMKGLFYLNLDRSLTIPKLQLSAKQNSSFGMTACPFPTCW
jgi:hypothetical protein